MAGGRALPFSLPAGTPEAFARQLEITYDTAREAIDLELSQREEYCLQAMLGTTLLQQVFAAIDAEAARTDRTRAVQRDPLGPLREAKKRKEQWREVQEELRQRSDQHCGDHGGGQGGTRVLGALRRIVEEKRVLLRKAQWKALARAQQTDPWGINPAWTPDANVTPEQAAWALLAVASGLLAPEVLPAEWPALMPAFATLAH